MNQEEGRLKLGMEPFARTRGMADSLAVNTFNKCASKSTLNLHIIKKEGVLPACFLSLYAEPAQKHRTREGRSTSIVIASNTWL